MQYLIIIFILFFFSESLTAQSKYFIYFVDKGNPDSEIINKSSQSYQSALNSLSTKAIARRKQSMGKDEIISFEDIPIKKNYINELENLGIEIIHQLRWFNSVSAYLSDSELEIVRELKFVEKVETVGKIIFNRSNEFTEEIFNRHNNQLQKSNNGDYGPSLIQYALSEIPEVHNLDINGEGVLIGVLDTGFKWKTHPALKNMNIIAERDFVFGDDVTENEALDQINQHDHGTYVLSLVGGYDPGNIIGTAYGASYIIAKTEDVRSERNIEEDNYAAAIEWMESLGVDITTSSIGYNEFDIGQSSYTYEDMNGRTSIVTRALELAYERGVVTFASAGNEGGNDWRHIISPADGFNVIAVGAVNSANELARFSSIGPTYDGRIKPEIVADGVTVYGARAYDNTYSTQSGTSASTPIAAGIGGLLLSKYPHLTNEQVRRIILESGDNAADPNNQIGYGLVSAKKALSFPNLSFDGSRYSLNKMIIDSNGVNTSTVKIHYAVNGESYITSDLIYDSDNVFGFDFPSLFDDDSISFYITYSDLSGSNLRAPQTGEYKFVYGSMDIYNETGPGVYPDKPSSYKLYQNYPNPFAVNYYNTTIIRFDSEENVKAEFYLYNSLGQLIKQSVIIAAEGMNLITWNGKNESGREVAGGVYIYLLKIGNEIFSNKLVLYK
ncbi:MAG: S8 family serine peptidase [Melioribacteraceae bacterium]|nr:S8 family serine peptidase [Melioribacteraceae bacterium]MCF8356557.1 S8 family serine peptidase [Melioribacteraceae bacterium]MCF8394216.1 S8 family serine peptidase [Melioribacteraceae bacterium]MCF8419936.1 S8 family serine peptidase [Melioribacteraceae bacterium]